MKVFVMFKTWDFYDALIDTDDISVKEYVASVRRQTGAKRLHYKTFEAD